MSAKRLLRCCVFFLLVVKEVSLLENGLARKPPMGWMSWNYYLCGTRCDKHPEKCLDENLIMSVADAFYTQGYLEAGYEYIIIDDCWSEGRRDSKGRLVANRRRFPRGMKFLADYIHNRGLKFGMYTNIENVTCMGFPGSKNHFEQDANTFAEWGIDYLKVDGCFASDELLSTAYINFGSYLNKTGRPIVYSCSWPFYKQLLNNNKTVQNGEVIFSDDTGDMVLERVMTIREFLDFLLRHGSNFCLDLAEIGHDSIAILSIGCRYRNNTIGELTVTNVDVRENIFSTAKPDYEKIASVCNLYRNYYDISTSFNEVAFIYHHYLENAVYFKQFHGPGHWLDPDMLVLGTNSLSPGQSRIQMSVWTMLSAPLLISCDMRRVTEYERQLLQNLDLLAIAQDEHGIMATPVKMGIGLTLWVKPHNPMKGDIFYSYSFALVNLLKSPKTISFKPMDHGLSSNDSYSVMDIFKTTFIKNVTLTDSIEMAVLPNDVVMYTLYPL